MKYRVIRLQMASSPWALVRPYTLRALGRSAASQGCWPSPENTVLSEIYISFASTARAARTMFSVPMPLTSAHFSGSVSACSTSV